jgi:hypothetical protein
MCLRTWLELALYTWYLRQTPSPHHAHATKEICTFIPDPETCTETQFALSASTKQKAAQHRDAPGSIVRRKTVSRSLPRSDEELGQGDVYSSGAEEGRSYS